MVCITWSKDEEDITQLVKQKKALAKERDELFEEVVELRANVTSLGSKQQETEQARARSEEEAASLKVCTRLP